MIDNQRVTHVGDGVGTILTCKEDESEKIRTCNETVKSSKDLKKIIDVIGEWSALLT